jgi:ADP-dependent NAD(P)H-hydrate dehydratase / NAD(P)H-hydrate epimerase
MDLVTAAEMRTLDRLTIERYGTPGHVLMERAGRGATEALLACLPRLRRAGRRAVIVAGKGNNGGDGFVIARLLRRRGVRTEVVLLGRAAAVGGDAARMLRAYRTGRAPLHEIEDGAHLGVLARALDGADVVVDAIFGTGLDKPVRGLHAEAIELINASGVPVFAVDIPSGLNADTGMPMGTAIQAEATATFGFAKLGQALYPGVRHCGRLAVVDIGIAAAAIAAHPPSAALLDAAAVARLVPARQPDAHKGDCGHVLVIAGSFGKTGAAQLAARAAARVGAGLVTVVAPVSLYSIYAAGVREAMTEALPDDDGRIRFDAARLQALSAGKTAVVIGPGVGTHSGAEETVRWLLANLDMPIVVDADAITVLARDPAALRSSRAQALLTPHPGEMSRLLATDTAAVQADRAGVARRFASEQRCTLVLKGARSVIADAGGRIWVNPTGNPGMASGGMGDVLSGVLGGLLAQGLSTSEAACLGVYLHGAVADRIAADGQIGLLASDIADGLRVGLGTLAAARPHEP